MIHAQRDRGHIPEERMRKGVSHRIISNELVKLSGIDTLSLEKFLQFS